MVKKLELGHITIIGQVTTNKKYYSFVSVMGPSLKQIKERCRKQREGGRKEEGKTRGRMREKRKDGWVDRGRNEEGIEEGMRKG